LQQSKANPYLSILVIWTTGIINADMPRGYNGTTWKKMDKPITDEEEVLKANRQSFRDETIRAFIQEVQSDIQQGRPIIMGGDFNGM